MVELIANTCPGGTQYFCRLSDGGGFSQALEIELVAADSPRVQEAIQRRVQMKIDIEDQVHKARRRRLRELSIEAAGEEQAE